jgi:xyloglucan-specific exo-beta-1,4-glucanase
MITKMKKNYFLLFLLLLASWSGKAQNVWKNVQIGGGGFVSGIITSKNDADLKYARTDVGGAYRWDAATKKWISLLDWLSIDQVGYFGVESLAIDPQNNNVVYLLVGTSYFNNGKTAILKSTNKGNTFTEIEVTSQFKAHGNGMGRSNGERLAVDPNNSNIIYCGTRNNGIFQSIDAGLTWNKLSGFPVTTTSNENGVCFCCFGSGFGFRR